MKVVATSLILPLLALCAVPTGAADPEQAAVEKFLRDNGLSPRSRPSWDERSAIEVRGTERNPELAPTSCSTRQEGRTSLKGRRFTYEADNRGEFGGELNLREGTESPRPIVQGNVRHLIAVDDDLYVFTGLDHLLSTGGVDVVENYDSKPRSRHLTETPEAPGVIELDLNWRGFLIVSPLSVSLVTLQAHLDVIMARHAYLPRPNSVLTIGAADILVGVCGGVAWIHAPWRMNRPPDPADEIPVVTYWTKE